MCVNLGKCKNLDQCKKTVNVFTRCKKRTMDVSAAY